jgi:phosphatidylserine/phosphatidylglycerophosphate/cardiolipin synthase-like enzyme
VDEVLRQWHADGNVTWKVPLLKQVLGASFSGKNSTPWAPGSLHDFMHAKVVVADDTVFVGSFNLSHSGEKNAENVLEITDAELANRLGAFVDEVRHRYPPASLPG